ncbi:MAG: AAA family ATPase [Peptoniphilaceae bacterium]|nr:AAA family ATPase [Peptoniphilaceae bacterium]
MEIQHLTLEKFGKFQQLSFDFSGGFSVWEGNNEDGKSTILDSIQLIFYGSMQRGGDPRTNLRRRYVKSGSRGVIFFTENEKKYRLERKFGKTNGQDSVELREEMTGQAVSLPAKKTPGDLFFLMDADSFRRSVLFGSSGSIIHAQKDDMLLDSLLNLQTTGDEATSFTQVAKILQDQEKLLVKNRGNGGILVDAEKRLVRLKEEQSFLEGREEERREKEKAIAEWKKKKEDSDTEASALREKVHVLEEKAKSFDLFLIRDRIRQKEELEKKIRERSNHLQRKSKIRDFSEAREAREKLSRLEFQKSQYRELLSSREKVREKYKNEISEAQQAWQEAGARAEEARKERDALGKGPQGIPSGAYAMLVFAMILFGGAFAIGTIFFLKTRMSTAFAAVLFLVIEIILVCLLIQQTKKKRLSQMWLEKNEQWLRLKEEENAVSTRYHSMEKERDRRNQETELQLQNLTESMEAVQNELRSMLGESGETVHDFSETLAEAEEAILAIRDLETEKEHVTEQLPDPWRHASVTDLGNELESRGISPEDEKSREHILQQIQGLHEEERRLQEDDALLQKKIVQSQSEIRAEFAQYRSLEPVLAEQRSLSEYLHDLRKKRSALQIAQEALEKAFEKAQSGFSPELNRRASEIFSELTGQKYDSLRVDRAFSLTAETAESRELFDWQYLSTGTAEQAYFALRIALSEIIAGKKNLPIFLDDSFAYYDDERAERAARFLEGYSKTYHKQILLFTSHRRFRQWIKTVESMNGATCD